MRPRLFTSAAFRFALLFAALFLAGASGVLLFMWWSAIGALDRQTNAGIRSDVAALTERFREGGAAALAQAVNERLVDVGEEEGVYLLVDGNGVKLAGNVAFWPEQVDQGAQWWELAMGVNGTSMTVRVTEVELPDASRLLVGRGISERARLRVALAEAVGWAAGVALLLAAGAGGLVRRSLAARLAPVGAAAIAFAAGDLAQRVPRRGVADEFDQLAATVNTMLDRIDRLMGGVRDVSNAIAHDLRTPITRARARLDDALRTAPDEPTLRAAIERCLVDLDDIVAVFQALLRIAEIEAGARRSAFARFDLGALLADLAETYGVVAEERGMTVVFDAPAALPVIGDRELIQQAVTNLLDNALKFSPPGASVQLAVFTTPAGVGIEVRDPGRGMTEPERARATDRFWRGEAARNTPGSGLGLSVVRAVAQLHSGQLELLDADPGLRARLVLPAT